MSEPGALLKARTAYRTSRQNSLIFVMEFSRSCDVLSQMPFFAGLLLGRRAKGDRKEGWIEKAKVCFSSAREPERSDCSRPDADDGKAKKDDWRTTGRNKSPRQEDQT